MKVLLIGNISDTIILFRQHLIIKLIEKGNSVYTLTMDNNPDNFARIRKYGAIPKSYFFSRSGINPFVDIINTYKLSKEIKNIKPDIVLCFFPKPVIYGTIAAKIAGVKSIYNLLEGLGFCYTQSLGRESFKKIFLKKIQTLLYKFSLPLANKILFLNADDYRDLILENNIRIKDFEVIGGIGVNLKNYTYMQPDISAIHFGMVSRLLIEKGVREFVEAARFVKTIYPQVKFSIAGAVDDNPGGISREQVATWEKEGVVKFLGQVSDINEYLSNINIFVLPSYREGIPRSTQEAMAMGLPVITTDVPGCRETVKNEVNGLVVPPWDAEALVEAMTFFIANPEKIIAMGKQSRIMAEEKFDENEATSKLLRVFFN